MITTTELLQGKSSEAAEPLLQNITEKTERDILQSLDSLDSSGGRYYMKIQELIALHFKSKIIAVWTQNDVYRICKEYNLQECRWKDYVGYAPHEVEQLVQEITSFIEKHQLSWKNSYGAEFGTNIAILCDENLIHRVADPFLCISVGISNCTYFVMHKWGPDVTEERRQIVELRNKNENNKSFLRKLRNLL